jgi:hypothetical protein
MLLSLPLFLLFQAGYLSTSCLSLAQAARRRHGPSIPVPLTQAKNW